MDFIINAIESLRAKRGAAVSGMTMSLIGIAIAILIATSIFGNIYNASNISYVTGASSAMLVLVPVVFAAVIILKALGKI